MKRFIYGSRIIFFQKFALKDEKGFFNLKPGFLEVLNLIPIFFKILFLFFLNYLRIFRIKNKIKKKIKKI